MFQCWCWHHWTLQASAMAPLQLQRLSCVLVLAAHVPVPWMQVQLSTWLMMFMMWKAVSSALGWGRRGGKADLHRTHGTIAISHGWIDGHSIFPFAQYRYRYTFLSSSKLPFVAASRLRFHFSFHFTQPTSSNTPVSPAPP